uniref:Reverse transcriptase domain-containing protein n=1 Tax=Tanacetum cinerariifolium TaxID=118510 RepID=A0A6L2M2N8_TANCI|nr:reverse transcriptase domain-containing protein [Tanacetum cinerariifolium]
MSTRSSARNIFPPLDNPELTIRRRSRTDLTLLNDFEMAAKGNDDLPVPDLRTMEELCQPSLNGRVQNSCQFHGLPGDDANKHLDKFLHVTQSIKVNGVIDDALRLYLFPHSLTHHATACSEMITNFRQHPDETLFEACERYKLSIDRCHNHNMLLVTQIDTFYNGLTLRHRDTINAATGGTFMKRRPEEWYDLIDNMITHHNDWDTSAQRTTIGNTKSVYAAGAYHGNSYQPQGNHNLLSYRSDNYLGPPGSSHPRVPLILRILFLRMARALLDVHGDFILEEIEIFLRTPDELSNLDDDYYDTEGDIHSLEKFLNEDPSPNLPSIKNEDLKQVEIAMTEPSIEEPPELELKDLPSHLEYLILEGTNKLPIIISKELKNEEKAALLKVLKSHKRAIAWKISDIKGYFQIPIDLQDQDKTTFTRLYGTFTIDACLSAYVMLRAHSKGSFTWSNQPPTYQAPAYQAPVYQALVHQPQIPQPQFVTTNEFTNFIKANDAILKNMQTNVTSLTNSNLELKNMFGQFMKMNTASSSSSRTLPGNTITNPKEDLKGITTRSGTAYQGPTIPTTTSSFSLVVERETEATKDTVHPTNNGITEDVQPPVVQTESPILNSEPVISPIIELVASPVSALKPNQRPSIPYPLRFQDQKLRDKVNDQRENFFQIFKDLNFNISFADALILMPKLCPSIKSLLTNKDKLCELTLRVGKEAITFNLDQTSRYSANYNDMTANRIDVIDMACEEYSQEVLGFFDVIASGNPTPYYDPIVSTTSPTLTLYGNSDFLLEEVDAFLALEDDPTSPEVDQSYVDTEGDILLLEAFLNDDPSLPPPNQGNYLPQVRKNLKSLKLKPINLQLMNLLSVEEKTALITVLKSHKRAIAWKLSDIKDQEKTTFTCPYGTFAYRRMPFGYAMHRARFREKMLKRCEDTNLCLNWEKSHFMVKEGIVLGHKISKNEIEVDKAKVDVIAKLPHPTTVKGIRNFLGHAGFY